MTTDTVAGTPAPARLDRHSRTMFAGILIGLALAAMSQTLVTTALPTIVGELGGLESLSWVVSAYLLASTVVVPFAGKLSDRHGSARLFRLAIVVFAAGSLAAALSPSMPVLVAARGIQGVGGGAIMTLAFTLIGQLVTPRERGRFQGYVASVFAATSLTGPLVGGFFVDHLSWRWSFHLTFVLSGVALAVIRRNLPTELAGRHPPRLDVAGALLLVGGLVATMLAAMWGGQVYAWTSPPILVLGAAAALSFVAFVRQERRAADPFVPLTLFSSRVVRVSTALGFVTSLTMFGVTVYAPTFLQVALRTSATRSGLLLVPLMGCILVGSTAGGRLMSRTAQFKPVAVTGAIACAAGAALLATLDASSPLLLPSIYVGVFGLGLGLTLPVTLVAVQNSVSANHLGAATSLTQFSRKIGATLGVAALGGVFNARTRADLTAVDGLPAGKTVDSLLESPAEMDGLPAAAAESVREAVAGGATLVFTVAFGAALVALVVALLLPNDRLHDGDDLAR